jgi:hypothetical protein
LHGASFDVATGEIEDSGPCLNQVQVAPFSPLIPIAYLLHRRLLCLSMRLTQIPLASKI